MRRIWELWLLVVLPLAAADTARLEFALGVLAESRDEASAHEHFEKARLADPLALPLVQRAVAHCLANDDRAGAVKLFRDLASARPDDLAVQLPYADFLEQQGRGDSMALKLATDALEHSLKNHPGHPEIIRRLHQFYQTSDRKSLAAGLLEQLDPADPASALLYASLARNASEADDAAQRARLDEHYQTSLSANPQIAELARDASEYFRKTERLDMAIDVLEKHVAAAPSSLALRTRLGVLLFSAKQDEKGEAVLKEVLAIHPDQALAHQALAKFYRLRDQPDPARFHAGELLKIRGGSPDDFLKLADEWLAAENPREARILLEKAVFRHPDDWELGQKLAIATRRDPDARDTAPRLFRQAEATRPTGMKSDPAFLVEFAEALLSEGSNKAAEDRLRDAIRSFPPEAKKETAAALRKLAAIWESENRNADAGRALRQRADALDR